MIKLSKRLATIASFCHKNDSVIDVGCDHGLLSIYLHDKVHKILATDINSKALDQAKNNFQKYQVTIPTLVCDGLDNPYIKEYDTLVIAGMGAQTIIHILNDIQKLINIKKIIISAHNHQELVRRHLNKIGFYLKEEKIIFDKHYYFIMVFEKGNIKHSNKLNQYGIIKEENLGFYRYMFQKDELLLNKELDEKTKIKLKEEKEFYKKVIEKIGELK